MSEQKTEAKTYKKQLTKVNEAYLPMITKQLEKNKWNVDIVVTHTCPMKYEPREVFLTGIDQKNVDKTTEAWLDSIEERLFYSNWFYGHFHTEKEIDNIQFLFENYVEIPSKKKLLGGES